MVGCACIKQGDPVNFVVPTGNFGNILAGYYAKRMGLPVHKLICASNSNNVLTDFINDGVYDANRAFFTTLSPSMDILVSSNLERLLFELTDRDSEAVCDMMEKLSKERRYAISDEMKARLTEDFWGGYIDDAHCAAVIKKTLDEVGYLVDPHTAVALGVYDDYKAATGDTLPTVIISTASPFKFAGSVLKALECTLPADEFAAVRMLARNTGVPVPESLEALENKKIRFSKVILPSEMPEEIEAFASNIK